jgi:hypothetical protein
LCFSLFRGRRYAHEQDWWPDLLLIRPANSRPGEAIYKNTVIIRLAGIEDLPKTPAEITIIGSGPSVSPQDFSSLPPRSAILLNGAIHLLDGRLNDPLAVVVEDERFIWRHFSSMAEFVLPETYCLFSTSVLRAICEIDPLWLSPRKIIHIDFLQKPYGQPRRSSEELKTLPFLRWSDRSNAISLMPQQGIYAGGSVVVSALQIALYLQPRKLGFAGIDLSNANEPRFYENQAETAKSRISAVEDKILDICALALDECRRRAINMVNYSPISSLSKIGVPYDGRLSNSSRHKEV